MNTNNAKDSPVAVPQENHETRSVQQIMDELYTAKTCLAQWQDEVFLLEMELFLSLTGYEKHGAIPNAYIPEIIRRFCDR